MTPSYEQMLGKVHTDYNRNFIKMDSVFQEFKKSFGYDELLERSKFGKETKRQALIKHKDKLMTEEYKDLLREEKRLYRKSASIVRKIKKVEKRGKK